MEQTLNRIPQECEEDDLKVTGKIIFYTMNMWVLLYLMKDIFLS